MGASVIVASERTTGGPVVELVGPAGAGKTTVFKALRQRNRNIQAGLTISRISYVKDAPSLVPTFVRFHRPFQTLLRKEMKRVLYLTTLYRLLRHAQAKRTDPVIFDEGPVYMLSRLLFLGKSAVTNAAFDEWQRNEILRWGQTLRLIIWLDADTSTLMRRIRTRPGAPPIPDTSDCALRPFLEEYRAIYRRVIHALVLERRTALLSINSADTSIDSIVDRILMRMSRS
jgi:shikimate kinase